MIAKNSTNPTTKSIILAGSFGIPPRKDLTINRAPSMKYICQGSETPAPKISKSPAIRSISPSILTTIIFKTPIPLKN